MKLTADEALTRFEGRVLPAMFTRYEPGCCIAVTRVAVQTLRRLGFDASPLPVQTVAFNPEASRRIAGGADPVDFREDDACWPVSIGFGGDPEPGRWPGHLCLVVDGLLADFTLGGIGETGRFAGKWWPEHWRNPTRLRAHRSAGR